MTSSKNTKRALLASVLSVVLCCAMLIGSTFAWFTDSVTSTGNKIVAGNLKVDLVHVGGGEDGTDVSIKENSDHKIFDYDKWEPGYTVMETLKVVNKGNLALKFRLDAVAAGATTGPTGEKLADVIDVWVYEGEGTPTTKSFAEMTADANWRNAGSLSTLMADPDGIARGVLLPEKAKPTNDEPVKEVQMTVALHMQETAGNAYQGLTLGRLNFTLMAAQYTYEEDAFDDQYDAQAEYLMVDSVDDLQTQLGAAQSGDTVVLSSAFDGTLTLPEEMAEGVTIASMGAQVDKIEISNAVNDVTFDGFVFNEVTANAIELANGVDIGTVTFKDCAITGTGVKGGRGFSGGNQNTELVFEDCTFSDIGYPIYDAFNGYKSLTIRGCTFSNSAPEGAKSWAIMIQQAVDTVVIDGCTFDGCTDGILKMTGGCTTSFTFTNNTMTNCDEHDPYGLFQLSFGGDCSKTISGNTLDGSDFNTLTN